MNTSSEFQNTQDKPEASAGLECNICYENSTEPVTTTCGHIYCWSCIYKWLHAKPDNNYCPVCKNVVTEEKLIPLFTKNNTHHQRKAEDIPKRPQPQREERKENNANGGRGGFGFNFGANPFFNSMFGGININMPNMAINVGFPTLIPMLIIFAIRFLSGLVSDFDEETVQTNHYGHNHKTTSGSNHGNNYNSNYRYARSSRSAEVDEPDNLLFNILVLAVIMLFFALPAIARKLRRN